MFEHIVVIVDESETSQYAVGSSITVALAVDAQIHFFLTIDPDLTACDIGAIPMAQMARELREKTLRETLARAEKAGVRNATGAVIAEDAVTAVVAVARARNADAIMLGIAPRVGILRPFIRNIAEAILKETTIPVCCVRRPSRGILTHRIIVPIVNDALAAIAVSEAIKIALRFNSTLIFCSFPTGSGDTSARHGVAKAMSMAHEAGVAAEQFVLDLCDNVPKAIIENASLQSCDAIVMATHLRQGIPRIIEGSITDAVVYQSDLPVIVVRSPSLA